MVLVVDPVKFTLQVVEVMGKFKKGKVRYFYLCAQSEALVKRVASTLGTTYHSDGLGRWRIMLFGDDALKLADSIYRYASVDLQLQIDKFRS
jgi:hypothetical protein